MQLQESFLGVADVAEVAPSDCLVDFVDRAVRTARRREKIVKIAAMRNWAEKKVEVIISIHKT